mgnify:CR=1 FL=1
MQQQLKLNLPVIWLNLPTCILKQVTRPSCAMASFGPPFQTGIGPVSVQISKVRSMDGTPVTFRSALVPPYVRRPKTLEAALPWLNLKGISSGEMGAALKVLLGSEAKSLSANTVSRLKGEWAKEYDA